MQRVRPRDLMLPLPSTAVADPASTAMEGLEWAFRRYSSYVAAIALRLLGRDDEVDDVVQEVFLVALKGMGKVRDPGAFKGWLATVTVRLAVRRLRLRRLRAFLGLDHPPDYEEVVAPGASQEERALLARIYQILDEQPVAQRIAWTLRHVEGERLEAVARTCGCSLATAKRRIAAVQEVLERTLNGPAPHAPKGHL